MRSMTSSPLKRDGSTARAGGAARGSPYPVAINRLIDEFAALPGIGRRSAERLAFYVLKSEPGVAAGLARAIEAAKRDVRHCSICSNLTDADPCPICQDAKRDRGCVLVVEQPKDLIALEQTGLHKGVYHVLLGHLSPLDGLGPEALTVFRLLERVREAGSNSGGVPVNEIVLGLNPTVEGDGTGLYLSEEIKRIGGGRVKLSRLARGLPSGGQLEYANKAVLADAIQGRQAVE
jgi:recombination protein RecR